MFGFDLGDKRVEVGLRASEGGNVGACCCESKSCSPAYTTGSTSYEDDFALEGTREFGRGDEGVAIMVDGDSSRGGGVERHCEGSVLRLDLRSSGVKI